MGQASTRLLIVDDDREIRLLLAAQLRNAGYEVLTAADGEEMRGALHRVGGVDLVILDLNLPREDGLTLCQELRRKSDLPVIMLTARSSPDDRILGLDTGADDYLPKPFEPRELEARINSVLRRTQALPPNFQAPAARAAVFADWRLDFERRELTDPSGRLVMLSSAEFRLLRVLAEHATRVLSRDQLLTLANGKPGENVERVIDLQISRLRRKLRGAPDLIKTVRHEGYVLAEPATFE